MLSLTGATCELTRVFADFLPTDSEIAAQWTLLSAVRAGNTLYAAFSSNFATYSTYALSLADGSSFPLSDAPMRFLIPLADGQLLACVNPPISSIDESCFALLDADSGESSRLCALPAHKHMRASRWTAIPSISPTARRFTAPRRPMMLWNPSAICRRWTRAPVCPR